jgi:hypothetical protein
MSLYRDETIDATGLHPNEYDDTAIYEYIDDTRDAIVSRIVVFENVIAVEEIKDGENVKRTILFQNHETIKTKINDEGKLMVKITLPKISDTEAWYNVGNQITLLWTQVNTNSTAIANNAGNISTNAGNISTNAGNIETNSDRIDEFENAILIEDTDDASTKIKIDTNRELEIKFSFDYGGIGADPFFNGLETAGQSVLGDTYQQLVTNLGWINLEQEIKKTWIKSFITEAKLAALAKSLGLNFAGDAADFAMGILTDTTQSVLSATKNITTDNLTDTPFYVEGDWTDFITGDSRQFKMGHTGALQIQEDADGNNQFTVLHDNDTIKLNADNQLYTDFTQGITLDKGLKVSKGADGNLINKIEVAYDNNTIKLNSAKELYADPDFTQAINTDKGLKVSEGADGNLINKIEVAYDNDTIKLNAANELYVDVVGVNGVWTETEETIDTDTIKYASYGNHKVYEEDQEITLTKYETIIIETPEPTSTTTPEFDDRYANGYTITYPVGTHSLTFEADYQVDILIVGGGGGAVQDGNAGAGANVIYAQNVVVPKGTYEISVGSGGNVEEDGASSSAFGATALGGGAATSLKSGSSTVNTDLGILNDYVVQNLPTTSYDGKEQISSSTTTTKTITQLVTVTTTTTITNFWYVNTDTPLLCWFELNTEKQLTDNTVNNSVLTKTRGTHYYNWNGNDDYILFWGADAVGWIPPFTENKFSVSLWVSPWYIRVQPLFGLGKLSSHGGYLQVWLDVNNNLTFQIMTADGIKYLNTYYKVSNVPTKTHLYFDFEEENTTTSQYINTFYGWYYRWTFTSKININVYANGTLINTYLMILGSFSYNGAYYSTTEPENVLGEPILDFSEMVNGEKKVNLQIGMVNGNSSSASTYFKEFRIYDRFLTEEEISELADAPPPEEIEVVTETQEEQEVEVDDVTTTITEYSGAASVYGVNSVGINGGENIYFDILPTRIYVSGGGTSLETTEIYNHDDDTTTTTTVLGTKPGGGSSTQSLYGFGGSSSSPIGGDGVVIVRYSIPPDTQETTSRVLKYITEETIDDYTKTYTAGTGMSLDGYTFNCDIVNTDTTYSAGTAISIDGTNKISIKYDANTMDVVNNELKCKVVNTDTTYSSGTAISIDGTNKISVKYDANTMEVVDNKLKCTVVNTDTTYTAGTAISIDGTNKISIKYDTNTMDVVNNELKCKVVNTDTTYSSGTAILIDGTNKISVKYDANTMDVVNNELKCKVVNTDTTYTAGIGMSLDGYTFNCDIVNTDTTYSAGTAISIDGTNKISVQYDANTMEVVDNKLKCTVNTYSAGTNMELNGTEFKMKPDIDLTSLTTERATITGDAEQQIITETPELLNNVVDYYEIIDFKTYDVKPSVHQEITIQGSHLEGRGENWDIDLKELYKISNNEVYHRYFSIKKVAGENPDDYGWHPVYDGNILADFTISAMIIVPENKFSYTLPANPGETPQDEFKHFYNRFLEFWDIVGLSNDQYKCMGIEFNGNEMVYTLYHKYTGGGGSGDKQTHERFQIPNPSVPRHYVWTYFRGDNPRLSKITCFIDGEYHHTLHLNHLSSSDSFDFRKINIGRQNIHEDYLLSQFIRQSQYTEYPVGTICEEILYKNLSYGRNWYDVDAPTGDDIQKIKDVYIFTSGITVPEILSVNGGIYAKRLVVDNLVALNYDIYNASESKSSKLSISSDPLDSTRRNLLIDDEVLNVDWADITNKPTIPTYTAGTAISIPTDGNDKNKISVLYDTNTMDVVNNELKCKVVNTDTTYSSGTAISIDGTDNAISVQYDTTTMEVLDNKLKCKVVNTDTTYSSGTAISIDGTDNAISVKYDSNTMDVVNNELKCTVVNTDTTYTAGTGISISADNVISSTGGSSSLSDYVPKTDIDGITMDFSTRTQGGYTVSIITFYKTHNGVLYKGVVEMLPS